MFGLSLLIILIIVVIFIISKIKDKYNKNLTYRENILKQSLMEKESTDEEKNDENSMPDDVFYDISLLKKQATEFKKDDIKKSIKLLIQALQITDRYYLDIKLHERIAKYYVIDKQFDKAFRFMQQTIYKAAKSNDIENYKRRYYEHMLVISETQSFICYKEKRLKEALFYKLGSISYDLILRSFNHLPDTNDKLFTFEEWVEWNSNRLYNNIMKNNEDVEKQIIVILKNIFQNYIEKVSICRKFYSDNSYIWVEAPNSEPENITQLIYEIEKIPHIISEEFNSIIKF